MLAVKAAYLLRCQTTEGIWRPACLKCQRMVWPQHQFQQGVPGVVQPLLALHLSVYRALFSQPALSCARLTREADLVHLLLGLGIAEIRAEEGLQQLCQDLIQ